MRWLLSKALLCAALLAVCLPLRLTTALAEGNASGQKNATTATGKAMPGVFQQTRIALPPPPDLGLTVNATVPPATVPPAGNQTHSLDSPQRIVRPVVHPDAFEEALGAPMELTIKQVDAVLVEALQQCGYSVEQLDLVEVAVRSDVGQGYLFQRLVLHLQGDADPLRVALRRLLAVQVPHATLEESRPGLWRIRILGRSTHELILASATTLITRPLPVPVSGARLAIVIDDMGASLAQARELLALASPVVFSILPYTEHARDVAEMAHAAGREVMVHLPMEPVRERISPGENALLVQLELGEISRRTALNLAGVPHAVGVNNHMGSRFTQRADLLRPALERIQEQGLFVLDSVTHERSVLAQTALEQGLPTYRRDVFLDVTRDVSGILYQIRKAERLALQHGQAVAIGHPYPETFEALRRWEASHHGGVVVVPLSRLAPLHRADVPVLPVEYAPGN